LTSGTGALKSSGSFSLRTADSSVSGTSGALSFKTGSSTSGSSGAIVFETGVSSNAVGGSMTIAVGVGGNTGGAVDISAGNSDSGIGGNVIIRSGNYGTVDAGTITAATDDGVRVTVSGAQASVAAETITLDSTGILDVESDSLTAEVQGPIDLTSSASSIVLTSSASPGIYLGATTGDIQVQNEFFAQTGYTVGNAEVFSVLPYVQNAYVGTLSSGSGPQYGLFVERGDSYDFIYDNVGIGDLTGSNLVVSVEVNPPLSTTFSDPFSWTSWVESVSTPTIVVRSTLLQDFGDDVWQDSVNAIVLPYTLSSISSDRICDSVLYDPSGSPSCGNIVQTSLCPFAGAVRYSSGMRGVSDSCFSSQTTYWMSIQSAAIFLLTQNVDEDRLMVETKGSFNRGFMVSPRTYFYGFVFGDNPNIVGFVKARCDGVDTNGRTMPAVYHLHVADRSISPDVEHDRRTSTTTDEDRISNLMPGTPYLYVMYSSRGRCWAEEEHEMFFTTVATALARMWTSVDDSAFTAQLRGCIDTTTGQLQASLDCPAV